MAVHSTLFTGGSPMKKLIINFDGTGNEPGDAMAHNKDIEDDENISNILKIHLLAGGSLNNKDQAIEGQHSFYYPGVGVRGSFFRRLWRQAFAAKAPEIIMSEALEDLEQVYEQNDRLYIFGFSRGAAIARLFASRLARNGLQTSNGNLDPHPVIPFLGVFDTVAAFGKPNLDKATRPVSDVVFENGTISPIVRNALHLVSLDENRLAFRPTLMNDEPCVNEIWFPGVHSDIGGGYDKDGLSDNALSYMLDQATLFGLKLFSAARDIPKGNLRGRDHKNDPVTIQQKDVDIVPDLAQASHSHTQLWRNLTDTVAPRDATVVRENIPYGTPYKVHRSVQKRMELVPDYDPIPLKGDVFEFVE
jgi:uncharacterized protein (DUF2235 family)